ncbi:MAG: NYN domain-containing protein [Chloroflexota bacterium]|nr:NYN domain-containing protein [Chloroflexota bacterium]
MGRDILVDGYNVIKNSSTFQVVEAKNFAAARERLITQLRNRYRHTPHQVIVVFDGSGEVEQVSHELRIRIIYSRRGEKADQVIVRLAAEARLAGREVEMYSNDGEVRQGVAERGGNVGSTNQLTTQLYAAPRDVERRAKHRMAMRRIYHLDPNHEPDDEPEPPRHSGGKKKSKSSRHRT